MLVDRLAAPRAALAVTSLLASLMLGPMLSAAGDDEPVAISTDEESQDPGGGSSDTSPAPRQVPALNSGAIVGVVVRDCGGSPLAGCQGQGIPDLELGVRSVDGVLAANLRTGADGSFWAAVPPGAYVLENENRQLSAPVDVQTGEVTHLEVSIAPQ
jgi:hypothetical protein